MVVGFVWPKRWLGSFGQNGGWVRLAKMAVGFVWPKWWLGSFGQNGGWVRLAKMVVGFVWPKMPAARIRLSRRVEIPDRELAPRQRAPLVAVHRRQPSGELGIARRLGDEVAARAPHAHEIDLGGGDPAGGLVALRAGIRAGDLARQRLDLARQRGIAQRRQAQAVTAGVARRTRLAVPGLRAGAPSRIGAVGGEAVDADHAAAPGAGCSGAMTLNSASSTSATARRKVCASVARCRSSSRKAAWRRPSALVIRRSSRSNSPSQTDRLRAPTPAMVRPADASAAST